MIPGYRIVRELGRGGMATVYLAVQESLGREVALKILDASFVADAGFADRFLREARIAGGLKHRNLLPVYDAGRAGDALFLAMEFVPGDHAGRLRGGDPDDIRRCLIDVAAGLAHAHARGVVHRDIKPENILRREDGSWLLADFGIARSGQVTRELTGPQSVLGTPGYMSPEQWRGETVDGRSDLYSLGVLAHELLTGRAPFTGDSGWAIGMQHMNAPRPRLPDALSDWQDLLDRLMAIDPDARFASAGDVIAALGGKPEVTPQAITARPPSTAHPTVVLPAPRAPERSRVFSRAWTRAGAGLVVMLVVVGLAYGYRSRDAGVASPPAPARAEAAPLPAAADARSIAVLPLVNASMDPEQQFFSDGLSENLIDSLSRFDGLKVIGRISAFQFRDSTDDSATIGRTLGVAHLLTGSVQRAGDEVRIRVSLTRAADGSTLWSEHYDRPYENLFTLQDDIAQAVAEALRVKLLSPTAAAEHDDRPPGGDIAAYDAYLRGLKYWYDQDFPKAAEHMAEAVRIDPGYALAWARLSESLSTAATFQARSPASAREQIGEARAASETALRLAPDLGAAHTARASLAFYGLDARGALAECQRATALAPNDAMVLNSCGFTLAGIGKVKEAIRLRERLLSVEPMYDVNHREYADLLMATGRLDEAEKYLRIAEGLSEPRSYPRLLLAILRGDAQAAITAARETPRESRALHVALAAQLHPDRASADAALADAIATGAGVESGAYRIAQAHALRDDARGAVEWLERAPPSDLLFLLTDPLMLRLRDDPVFIAFCRKAGVAPPGESEALDIDRIRAISAG